MTRKRSSLQILAIFILGVSFLGSASGEDLCKGAVERGEFDEAIVACTAVLDAGGLSSVEKSAALGDRGRAYVGKRMYERAIQDYSQAIHFNPSNPEALNGRGIVFTKMGQHDLAIQDHTKAIQFKPDFAEAYNHRGVVYKLKGLYDQALMDFEHAIKLMPGYARAISNREDINAIKVQQSAHAKDSSYDARRWRPFTNKTVSFGYTEGYNVEEKIRPRR